MVDNIKVEIQKTIEMDMSNLIITIIILIMIIIIIFTIMNNIKDRNKKQ